MLEQTITVPGISLSPFKSFARTSTGSHEAKGRRKG